MKKACSGGAMPKKKSGGSTSKSAVVKKSLNITPTYKKGGMSKKGK